MSRVSNYREELFRSGLTSALQALSYPPFSSDAAAAPMCPPAALEVGVELLCRLFELWGQMGAGVLVLMQWLLGEEDEDEGPDEASSLDEEDFLFEKGDRNLWAEPLLWVKLLHRHLRSLVLRLDQERPDPEQLVLMEARARAEAHRSQQALESLPALPQFCCAAEHARLTLRQHRAGLVLNLLEELSSRT